MNLLSKIGIPKGGIKDCHNRDTDKVLVESCKNSEAVIIAWGSVSSKTKELAARAAEVIKLLVPFADKLFYLSDGTKHNLHPLCASLRGENKWRLVQGTFDTVVPSGNWDGEVTVTE